jgi:hypothetical protein
MNQFIFAEIPQIKNNISKIKEQNLKHIFYK